MPHQHFGQREPRSHGETHHEDRTIKSAASRAEPEHVYEYSQAHAGGAVRLEPGKGKP